MPAVQLGHAPATPLCPPQPFLLRVCHWRTTEALQCRLTSRAAVSLVLPLEVHSLCYENSRNCGHLVD